MLCQRMQIIGFSLNKIYRARIDDKKFILERAKIIWTANKLMQKKKNTRRPSFNDRHTKKKL